MSNANNKTRILLVSATSIFGGGEIHYVKLAKILSEKYALAGVVFNPELQTEFQNMGMQVWRGAIPVGCAVWKKYLIVARCMLKAICQYRPALVHLNGGLEGYLAIIPRICGVPVLITNHVVRPKTSTALLKRITLAVSTRLAEKVVCVSATAQNNLRQYAWTKNTVVIPNWLGNLPETKNRTAYDGKREFRLLFVGRVETAKGIFDLLRAMKYLTEVRLEVVGEGPDTLKAKNESDGLPVHFHGFHKDVAPFYAAADMFVFPSHLEGQGQTLIEAMSFGLPCLVSDIEAAIETSGNGRFAEKFRCGDSSDMAAKIRSLQNNPSRLAHLSDEGRRYALETYTEERVRPMYFHLVRSIVG